jgi:cytochrome bd-type quinol oxidase subunit 1
MAAPFGPYHVLLMVYVGALMGFAFISCLISSFYRRKFQQSSPRAGFVAALVFGVCFLLSYAFVRDDNTAAIRTLQIYLLLGCGIATMYNSLALYFTMKKVRK